jgi:hypothetical protein
MWRTANGKWLETVVTYDNVPILIKHNHEHKVLWAGGKGKFLYVFLLPQATKQKTDVKQAAKEILTVWPEYSKLFSFHSRMATTTPQPN